MKFLNGFIIILTLLLHIACKNTGSREPVHMMWFDATANWERLSTPDSLRKIMKKCADAGITDVVIDVKPITGQVLYRSDIAEQLHTWKGVIRDSSFDFLAESVRAGHGEGLKVHAAMNVFSEGNRLVNQGLVFTGHPEWQTVLNTPYGLFPISEVEDKLSMFVNPFHEDVLAYEFSLIREIVSGYGLDGLILDRGRFDSIQSDFSERTRKRFEEYIGMPVVNWPDDIFSWKTGPGTVSPEIVRGRHFKEWVFWRSMHIRTFFEEARRIVKREHPDVRFGNYAGSWYPTYYELGVNWGSECYRPEYDWALENYNETGYAEQLDFFCSGCYFAEVRKSDLDAAKNSIPPQRWEAAMGAGNEYWYCVEGACEMSMKVTQNTIPVYGSIYVLQYKDRPEIFRDAVRMCLDKTDGVMIFDLVYLEQYGWWDSLKKVLQK